jgi:hypothetical protein
MSFGGETFDEAKDGPRLGRQLSLVYSLMQDGEWRTLREIASELYQNIGHVSEAGVSARLRDLRKDKFGGHTVERRRVDGCNGLWQYRVIVAGEQAAA